MTNFRIDILGAGSLGLVMAGRLSRVPGTFVRLLTRTAEQAENLSASGFMLHEGDAVARVQLPAFVRCPDSSAHAVLVAVKSHQTAAAVREHGAAVGCGTLSVTLQNGLGADRILREAFPDQVAVGVTRLAAHRTADGVRLVAAGQTLVGPSPARFSGRRDELVARFRAAGLPAEPVDPVEPHVWRKLLVNAAINAPAALTNLRNGEWAGRPDAPGLIEAILAEGLAVAAAAGVTGVFADLAAARDEVLAVARLTAGNVCSMLADRRAGRESEIDFINDALCRLGHEHGVPTPVNRTLARLVRTAGPA